MANVYNKKFAKLFSTPSIAKERVGKPALFKIIGNVKNKKILELGCGNGYWLRELSKKGAHCAGIDNSDEQLKIAKQLNKTSKISFIKKDIMKPLKLKEKYDIVLLIKVILEESDKKKIINIIKNAKNALKKGGRLIILDLHPFAPNIQNTITTKKGFNYFHSGEAVRAMSTKIDGKKVYYNDHHWTFSDYSEFLQDKFLIKTIVEHRSSSALVKKFPSLENRLNKPMDMIIEAIKI